jgi:hypothetical protein
MDVEGDDDEELGRRGALRVGIEKSSSSFRGRPSIVSGHYKSQCLPIFSERRQCFAREQERRL